MKTMSVKLSDDMVAEIKAIAEVFDISYSDFIRVAIEKEIAEKKRDFIYRLSSVPYASLKEEQEIMEQLSQLSDDDLAVSRIEDVQI